MKKVTVIGSGNAFNTDGRAHPCFLLENNAGELLLLDLGATSLYRFQEMRFDIAPIDRLVLTHFHGDHFAGLPFFLLQLDLVCRRTKPFLIGGPPGVEEACGRLLEATYPGFEFGFRLDYLEITAPTRLAGFEIVPFPITHRPESTGYRISGPAGLVFAFSGDSAFDEKLFRLVAGADLAAIELTLIEKLEASGGHTSLEEVLAGRDRLEARRVLFTHLYDEIAALVEEHKIGIAAADGLEIYFS